MRASTVMRSMPTSETRTHASMTMPLSSTRSRTSIRLVPPAARSTGIRLSYRPTRRRGLLLQDAGSRLPARQRRELAFKQSDFLAELFVLGRQRLLARRQVVIVLPPVEADLLGLVDRANDQSNPNCEELHLGQRHLDVARHDEPLVEHAIE